MCVCVCVCVCVCFGVAFHLVLGEKVACAAVSPHSCTHCRHTHKWSFTRHSGSYTELRGFQSLSRTADCGQMLLVTTGGGRELAEKEAGVG